jgi:hypothetical protein
MDTDAAKETEEGTPLLLMLLVVRSLQLLW